VVSWSRSSTPPRVIERPLRASTSASMPTSPANTASRKSCPPRVPSDIEKNNVNVTIAATSATVAAAMVVCPTAPSTWRSISSPARNSKNARPISASTCRTTSTSTQPRTAGPTRIPATISSTADGTRTLGAKPRSSGATTAMAQTTSRLVRTRQAWAAAGRSGPGVSASDVTTGRRTSRTSLPITVASTSPNRRASSIDSTPRLAMTGVPAPSSVGAT